MGISKWTATTAILLQCLAASSIAAAVEADEVLQLAEDAGRWIAATAIDQEHGRIWPDDALAPAQVSHGLATGVSGKVVFFVALYRATGDPDYLQQARMGADFLVSMLDDPTQFGEGSRRASLYAGISGVGVALLHVSQETREPRYDEALNVVLETLDAWSVADSSGVHWSEQFNDLLFGDAGTTLFLAQVAADERSNRAATLASQGAHSLMQRSIIDGDVRYWLFRRDKDFNLPNFSHGTAGVAYVLATVARQTRDDALLLGARQGFAYVRSITERSDDRLRIPYGWGSDNWRDLYEFGWAHGLTGTSLMFLRMEQLGIERRQAAELLAATLSTLSRIGLPGEPDAPFAEPSTPLDFRFGRAGVLPIASYWAARNPEDADAATLRDALFHSIRAAAVRDGQTAHWQVDAPAFMGGERAAYTGMFHGAAGIGLALLSLHASLTGSPAYASLPDDPLSE